MSGLFFFVSPGDQINSYRISMSQMTTQCDIWSIYHQICNKSNMTSSTSGAEMAYPTGAAEFTPGFYL